MQPHNWIKMLDKWSKSQCFIFYLYNKRLLDLLPWFWQLVQLYRKHICLVQY